MRRLDHQVIDAAGTEAMFSLSAPLIAVVVIFVVSFYLVVPGPSGLLRRL